VHHYCDDWIRSITDVTASAHHLQCLVRARQLAAAEPALPAEEVYLLRPVLARRIGAGPGRQDGA
jgi:hypothetical protein